MNKRHMLVIGSAAIGFLVMLWSAQDWYALMTGSRMTASFCNVNAYWNCDRASLSSFGSLFSVPAGVFGAFWFWSIIFLALAAPASRLFLRVWVLLGMSVAVLMAGVLFFHLKTGCLVCLISYVLIFVSGGAAWSLTKTKSPSVLSGRMAALLIGVGVLVFGVYGAAKGSDLKGRVDEADFQAWFAQLKTEAVPTITPIVKNPGGAITVIEFSDFGCPFCAKAAEISMPYLSSQKDVTVYFYPFPLDGSCNRLAPRGSHRHSCDWSRVAFCAEEQGQFWPVHDRIFKMTAEARELPSVESVRARLPLDQEQLTACLASPETEAKLQRAIDVAGEVGIQSTPTFFVNQRRLEGFIPIPLLKRLLEELRK